MHRRISVILAATLLLLTLSGLQTGAESGSTTFYYDDVNNLWKSTSSKSHSEIQLVWEIKNTTINVQQTRQWNPATLSYEVTEITVTDWCSPTIEFRITNNSTQHYCSATASVVPAEDFTINVTSPVSVSREDKRTDNNGDIVYLTVNDQTLPEWDAITESVSCSSTNGQTTIGPWLTAVKRDYIRVYPDPIGSIVYDNSAGYSVLSFTLNATNPTLLASLTDINNWTGTSYNYGDSIKLADITITLSMVTPESVGYTK